MSMVLPDPSPPNPFDDLTHFPKLSSSEDTEEPMKEAEELKKSSPALDYEKVKTIHPCTDFSKHFQWLKTYFPDTMSMDACIFSTMSLKSGQLRMSINTLVGIQMIGNRH